MTKGTRGRPSFDLLYREDKAAVFTSAGYDASEERWFVSAPPGVPVLRRVQEQRRSQVVALTIKRQASSLYGPLSRGRRSVWDFPLLWLGFAVTSSLGASDRGSCDGC